MVVEHNEESNGSPSLAAIIITGLTTVAIAACILYQPDEITQCIDKLISINEGATVQHIGGPHKYLLFVVINSGSMEYYVKFVKHFSFQQDCSDHKGFHPYYEVFTSFEYNDFTYTAFKIPNNYKTYLQMTLEETTRQEFENKKLALTLLSIVENYHTHTNYYSDLDETSILIPTNSDPSKIIPVILANHYNLKCRTRGTEKYNKSPLTHVRKQVVYSIGKLLISDTDTCYSKMVSDSVVDRLSVAGAISCLNNNNQFLELISSLKNLFKNVINTISSKKEQNVVSTISHDIEQGMKVLNGKLFKRARLSIYIRIDAAGTNSVVLKPTEIEFQKSETLPNRIFPNSDKFVKIYKFYPLPNDSSNRISIMEMKYYPNGDLKKFTSNKNWNDFEKEYFVMESSIQILEALIELAGENYVHGDVKEENIFVDEFKSINNFKVVLADFTLAEKIFNTQGPPETSIENIFKEDVKRLSITIDKLLGSRTNRKGGKYIGECQTHMHNNSFTLEEARECIVSKQKAILLAEANLAEQTV